MSKPHNEKRAHPRLPLLTDVRLLGGSSCGSIRIREISASGFSGSTTSALEIGRRVTVCIDGLGVIQATVMRRNGSFIGMKFCRLIDLAMIDIVNASATQSAASQHDPFEEGAWK